MVYEARVNGWVYGGLDQYDDGISVSYAYEYAAELTNEILAYGEVNYGKENASTFLIRVIRAILKSYTANLCAPDFMVAKIKDDLE
jgi:hypothetical protein